jgi:P4 family phage/plasmid primase-like protien
MEERLRSVADVYARSPEKYQRVKTTKRTEEDVANMIIELDEAGLQTGVLAFETGPDKYEVYVAGESGIWERQEGYRKIKDRVRAVRLQLQRRLLEPLKFVLCYLHSRSEMGDEEAKVKQVEAEREYKHVDYLDTKLGSSSYVTSLTQLILRRKALDTENMEIRDSAGLFDTREDCIGFTDGVYDFERRALMRGARAQEYYVSQTVGYAYEEVTSCPEEEYRRCMRFLERIHPDREILDYVLRRIVAALRGVKEQLILVHYNVAGSNGKSTLFALIKMALGSLFMKGNSGVLSTPANPHGPNEELMSLKGKRLALFSEPSAKKELNIAFLKELTGGDEQSARGMHAKKVTFTFLGLVNLLCNKVPEFDDFDGGIKRRLRCVPYVSQFVESQDLVDPDKNVYPLDKKVDRSFKRWRYALMRRLLEVAVLEEVLEETPPAVLEHTRQLIKREDAMTAFIEANVHVTSSQKDVLRRQSLWARYLDVCASNKQRAVKYSEFNDEVALRLGQPIAKSDALSNFWRGMRLTEQSFGDE